ncbi:formate dehydrogenase subunit gamma [Salisediminibacterium beveridgei]|uniref:Formate dehydrogenase O gamma subunit n=1 Tax=Salisediminibacterium beveridgei TaxID=632773 RepID=A0A1D7QSX6_9BACI|nr:formate dehydrogenase subunit gamma [Salisediminibacterium beveridgei]AOM82091.1 Formate dehydrogenase O gamma subunit [Salisediminibacterium beveridgei]
MSTEINTTQKVKRFSKTSRVGHWVFALTFFMLYFTALPLYSDFFGWMYPLMGGPEMARLLHRIFAVVFIAVPVLMLIFDPKSMLFWLKSTFTWKKDDLKFLGQFPKEFFLGKGGGPKQGFYNSGEKLNSLLVILTAVFLILSGIVMWFPQFFSSGVIQWAFPIHNIAFGLSVAVIVGHIFLSIGHPNSKASLEGMTKGTVDVEYAKAHHEVWYDELVEKGKIKKDNQDKGA